MLGWFSGAVTRVVLARLRERLREAESAFKERKAELDKFRDEQIERLRVENALDKGKALDDIVIGLIGRK